MTRMVFMGECMVELRASQPGLLAQSFAGDVYNSAVYLKRCFPAIDTSLVTAVGQDALSDGMVARFAEEHIATDWVFRHAEKSPGMYLIETDTSGERHFTYWRSDSAARQVMAFLDTLVQQALAEADMLMFSGISLAVIEPAAREAFWQCMATLKAAGVKLVFDPNYRPRLWRGKDEAIKQFEQALACADWVLPGVEDFTSLLGLTDVEAVLEYCQPFGLDEVIVKNGPASVVSLVNRVKNTHTIVPVKNVVDTTSAGDAFNGVYLGARLCGSDPAQAISHAAAAAGSVIQFPGAIVPEPAFNAAMTAKGYGLG